MTGYLILQLAGLLFLVLLSAFFSSSEVAFFSLEAIQVERLCEKQPVRGRMIKNILASPTRLLSTILIGNTLVNVGISAAAYSVCVNLFGNSGEAVAVAGSLFLLLIFGEIGPKRIAVAHPDRMALLYAPLLNVFSFALTPLRILLENITDAFAHIFEPRGNIFSEDELSTVVDVSQERGVLADNERDMIKGIMRLEDLVAGDVMTPRVDMVGLDLDDPPEDLVEFARQSGVREIPVYMEQLDDVQGFLDVRGFMFDPVHQIASSLLPPYYVPEVASLHKLLDTMIQEHRRTAIVVDEYGGTAGILTRGDILEEVVGDLAREHGNEELLFEQTRPGRWLLDGYVNLETVSEKLDLDFEDEGVDRISGWISAKLERIPRNGDFVDHKGYRFYVQKMRKNRVVLVAAVERMDA